MKNAILSARDCFTGRIHEDIALNRWQHLTRGCFHRSDRDVLVDVDGFMGAGSLLKM
jgi:hypothetical protein